MKELEEIQTEFTALSDFLIALGDEKRQAIIIALLEDQACVGRRVTELTEATQLSRPAVSHHLKILKQAKILVVLTNVSRYHGTEEPTGLWLGEATEFVEEVTKAGFSVDYVSPQGGYVPLDPRSMKYVDSSIMAVYESADFQERALAHSLSLEEIDPDEYAAIYFTGGHGVMWDFPDNPQLQAITRSLYEQGKYLTSVCHGIAGLLNVKDASGNYLVADKTITGFTTAEEILAMKKAVVPFLNETIAKEHGANFAKKRPYKEFAYQDGRIITGQNPFSVRAVARLLIQQLSK